MLVQRPNDYTPLQPFLATLRRQLAEELSHCPCQATQQRVLLAVNEIVANIIRHTRLPATFISVDFIDHDEGFYCVVLDNGGHFEAFQECWQKAAQGSVQKDMFMHGQVGLKIVYRLWPKAFYIPRCDAFPYNSFFLPLTEEGTKHLPEFFRPVEQTEWSFVLRSLIKERAA